jgi:hypothetical protein
MTLPAFQQALCTLIGSPQLCLEVRAGGAEFLDQYELSPRERDRLRDLVWQRGMSTNCTLYRSNRVTPVYTLLHYTCMALGERLKDNLEQYWAHAALRDLEFKHEIHRFAHFLKARIATSAIVDPFLEEILNFELAVNELRFAPRRELLRRLAGRDAAMVSSSDLRMHPLTRVVRFRHAPADLLGSLAQGRVPRDLPETEAFLLLSVVTDSLTATILEPTLGRPLCDLQADGMSHAWTDADRVGDLVNSGIVVRGAVPL